MGRGALPAGLGMRGIGGGGHYEPLRHHRAGGLGYSGKSSIGGDGSCFCCRAPVLAKAWGYARCRGVGHLSPVPSLS